MVQSPGQGGKASAPQGKTAATGATQAQGKAGSQGSAPSSSPGQGGKAQASSMLPGMLSLAQGAMSAQGGQAGGQQNPMSQNGTQQFDQNQNSITAQSQRLPPGSTMGFPVFTAQAQGFQGASADQQNPNSGGASTSNSSIQSPSTSQGGMT